MTPSYEIVVFSCPVCSGMAKRHAEKCAYCGTPFYWKDNRIDRAAMIKKAEEAWAPRIMDTHPPKDLVPPTRWSKRFVISIRKDDVVEAVDSISYDIKSEYDRSTMANPWDLRDRGVPRPVSTHVEGDIQVNLSAGRAYLMLDWLYKEDSCFDIVLVEMDEDGSAVIGKVVIKDCKIGQRERDDGTISGPIDEWFGFHTKRTYHFISMQPAVEAFV